ncbi:MAG: phage portal protein [Methylococcales bacterium]|nr:phage portal protein [Methylococcales bacterium]
MLLKTGNSAIRASYEGAAKGRRMGSWGSSNSDANAELLDNLELLRNRSREVIRNNPHAGSAVESLVANLIGTGIVPRWRLENAELKEQIQTLWQTWTKESDFYQQQDFYGLQSLVARSLMESGEVLIRYQINLAKDKVPFQLQILEADHLDAGFNEEKGSKTIRMGIEFNSKGLRQAYHLTQKHPGESSQSDKKRINADQILHVYRVLRPGQIRGVPWLSSILVRLHELDQYEDAELVRKKSAALFAAFVTRPMDDRELVGGNASTDQNGNSVTEIEPGAVHYLDSGESIDFSKPADVGSNYEAWLKQQLRSVATGIGVTYEQLTGDLHGVNYSSIRAGLLEFRRRIEGLQHNLIVYQFCRPVAQRWLDMAVASGQLQIPDYFQNKKLYQSIEWRPPAWDWVDPLKDILAQQLEVRSGFKSRAQVAADRGQDIEDLDKQIHEDQQRAEKYGLAFDSDPTQTNKTGSLQPETLIKREE